MSRSFRRHCSSDLLAGENFHSSALLAGSTRWRAVHVHLAIDGSRSRSLLCAPCVYRLGSLAFCYSDDTSRLQSPSRLFSSPNFYKAGLAAFGAIKSLHCYPNGPVGTLKLRLVSPELQDDAIEWRHWLAIHEAQIRPILCQHHYLRGPLIVIVIVTIITIAAADIFAKATTIGLKNALWR